MRDDYTTIYVTISKIDDEWINAFLKKKVSEDKKTYSKKEIIKILINNGIDVENEKYIKLNPEMDDFISQLQTITVEQGGQKYTYKKTKQQTYDWLIEKGLQHLND